MGFTIYYRSTRPVSPTEAEEIRRAADSVNEGRTWLSCEPVNFFPGLEDGRLAGGSKPNFSPHPDDVSSARLEGLPDGDVRSLLDGLCQLSRKYSVDWEFRHDESPVPIGYVRDGLCDEDVLSEVEMFADLARIMEEELEDPDFEGLD